MKRALAAFMIRRSLNEKDLPVDELELKHSNPDEPLFNDSSYFLGRGGDGSYMVVRMAFRSSREPEYWLSFHLPERGTYKLRDLDAEEGEGFQLGKLGFFCQEAGKRWKIQYRGSIHREENSHRVDLDLTFEATRPLVNFKNITLPSHTAPVIARERWTKGFLSRLREIKKVHLEQGGRITGTITLEGEKIAVNWRSVRDHSWGTRLWSTWKRHVWLGGVLDNGEAFNLSMISYDFMGQLSAGYLTRGDSVIYFDPLPAMESFAPQPQIPQKAVIEFHDRSGKRHRLEMTMPHHFDFMMDRVYFIREGMGDFVLDGVPGLGVAEFGLNSQYYDITTG
ncbi:MAG: hypothetical protein ABFS10_07720 [Bacteroidota bacterium]